jgi:hypothetical protein
MHLAFYLAWLAASCFARDLQVDLLLPREVKD